MQDRINIITLGTKDLVKATKFYQEGLGLPRMEHPGDISFFSLQGTWLALYPVEELAKDVGTIPSQRDGMFRAVTLAHLVENESAVEELLQVAQRAGAEIVKPAQKADWGGYSGYFSDLDGHLWEVAYNPFFWAGPK